MTPTVLPRLRQYSALAVAFLLGCGDDSAGASSATDPDAGQIQDSDEADMDGGRELGEEPPLDSTTPDWTSDCEPAPPLGVPFDGWSYGSTLASGVHEACGPGFRVSVPPGGLLATEAQIRVGQHVDPWEGYVAVTQSIGVYLLPDGLDGPWDVAPGLAWRVRLLPMGGPLANVEAHVETGALGEHVRRDVPVTWVDGGAEFELPSDWLVLPEGGRASFFLGAPASSSCGNGVVEDGEQCDEPGSRCIRCHYASPACRDDEWGCHRYCSTTGVDCATEPVGPCEYATCDSNSAECVRWPKLEGEPCVDGEVEGWCRGGVCDPRPEECALCSQGYRLIDGVCQPEEWGYSYVAGRIPSAAVAGYPVTLATPVTVDAGEPAGVIGAGVLDELFGRVVDLRPLIPTGAPDQSLRPGTVWHETMEYRFEGWEGWSTGATLTPYRAIWDEDDELISFDVPRTSGYGTWHWAWPESIARHYFGFEFPGVTFAEFGLYNDHFFASDEGLFYVSRLRQSTSDLGVCEVAVNVDGDWQTCPERPGAAMCDGRCIDTRQSEQHCGQCGNACGDAEICAGGECVCDPRLARLDLPTCAWDACPDGWYGPGCRSACPGILEGEPECYGRGECSDGPFGTGICMCTGGHHGADCIYSCSDGVRNGSEVNVDCGGLRCAPCR